MQSSTQNIGTIEIKQGDLQDEDTPFQASNSTKKQNIGLRDFQNNQMIDNQMNPNNYQNEQSFSPPFSPAMPTPKKLFIQNEIQSTSNFILQSQQKVQYQNFVTFETNNGLFQNISAPNQNNTFADQKDANFIHADRNINENDIQQNENSKINIIQQPTFINNFHKKRHQIQDQSLFKEMSEDSQRTDKSINQIYQKYMNNQNEITVQQQNLIANSIENQPQIRDIKQDYNNKYKSNQKNKNISFGSITSLSQFKMNDNTQVNQMQKSNNHYNFLMKNESPIEQYNKENQNFQNNLHMNPKIYTPQMHKNLQQIGLNQPSMEFEQSEENYKLNGLKNSKSNGMLVGNQHELIKLIQNQKEKSISKQQRLLNNSIRTKKQLLTSQSSGFNKLKIFLPQSSQQNSNNLNQVQQNMTQPINTLLNKSQSKSNIKEDKTIQNLSNYNENGHKIFKQIIVHKSLQNQINDKYQYRQFDNLVQKNQLMRQEIDNQIMDQIKSESFENKVHDAVINEEKDAKIQQNTRDSENNLQKMITLDLGESTYESVKINNNNQQSEIEKQQIGENEKEEMKNEQTVESMKKSGSQNSESQQKKYRSSEDDSLERDSKEILEEEDNILMETETLKQSYSKNNQAQDFIINPFKIEEQDNYQKQNKNHNLQIQIQPQSMQQLQNNNENTSSSLGKRNFKDYQKVQLQHKENNTNQQQMKNILIQDQNQIQKGENFQRQRSFAKENNNQQIKKRISQYNEKEMDNFQENIVLVQIKEQKESIQNQQKGKSLCLIRTNSDNFNINQAQKSAEKLFNQQFNEDKQNQDQQQKACDQPVRGKDTPNFQNFQKGNINPQQMHQLCKSETMHYSNEESYEFNQKLNNNLIEMNKSITIYQNEISNSQNDEMIENDSLKEEFNNSQKLYNDNQQYFEQPFNQKYALNHGNIIYNVNQNQSQQQLQTYQIIQNGFLIGQNLNMNNFPGNAQFNQMFQKVEKQSPIIRQLSFRSVSNASSSNINTPIQPKRMKLHGSSSQFQNSFRNSIQNEICYLKKQKQIDVNNQNHQLTQNKLFMQNIKPRASGQLEFPFYQQSCRQINMNFDLKNVDKVDSENKNKQQNLFNYPIQNLQTHQKKTDQSFDLNTHYSQGQNINMNSKYQKMNMERSIQSVKEKNDCAAISPKSLIVRWYAQDQIFDDMYSDGVSKPKSNIGTPVDNDSNQAKDKQNVLQFFDSVKIKNQSATNYFFKQENQTFPKILLQNQLNTELQKEGLGKTFSPSKLKHVNCSKLELRKVQSEKEQKGLLFQKSQSEAIQLQNDIKNRELHLDELQNANQVIDQNEINFQNLKNLQFNALNQNLNYPNGYQKNNSLKLIEEGKFQKDEFKNKEFNRPKNIFINNIQDMKSQGDPKTPVNNFGSLFKRTSQVSVTNTSMNDQSAFSSSLDTEGNHHYYGCAKKGKNLPQFRQFQVNQFRYPQNSKNNQQIIEAEHQPQPNELGQEAIGDVGGSSFFQNAQFQNDQRIMQKELFSQCMNNSTQSESSLKNEQVVFYQENQNAENKQDYQQQFFAEQQNQFKISPFSVSTSQMQKQNQQNNQNQKLSWLDKEFSKLAILGRGHFGQVIKCRNKTDNFEYAIKVTNSRIRNPNEREFYLQEMKTLSALSVGVECPYIVRYLNSWIEDERIHIVMELCEKSLRQVKKEAKFKRKYFEKLQRDQNAYNYQDQDNGSIVLTNEDKEYHGYIPERIIFKIMRDVLRGMNELHQKNIVHLDIKPENILIGKSGKYKIADLGMARFLLKISEADNIPEGDCRYLSKELLSKEVLNNIPDLKKSDVFSLGMTAYELISLVELEKNGANWRSLRDGENKFSVEIQELYSPQLLDTIRMMLSPNTDDRPSVQLLLDTVFQSIEQKQIYQLQIQMENLKQQNDKLIEFLKNNNVNIEQILFS